MKQLLLLGLVLTLMFSCKDGIDAERTSANKAEIEEFSNANIKGAAFVKSFYNENLPLNGRVSQEFSTELIIEGTDEYLKLEGFSEEERLSANEFLEGVLTSDSKPFYNGEVQCKHHLLLLWNWLSTKPVIIIRLSTISIC